jgi:hypothetical protein
MTERLYVGVGRAVMTTVRSNVVYVLLVTSVSLNVLQAERLRRGPERPLAPIVGAQVPAFDVIASDARRVTVDYASANRPTILYYFSPSCIWCQRNWNSVAALERATRGRYRFLAITAAGDDVRRGFAQTVPVPTYWGLGDTERRAYRFNGTPQTLVVSGDGRVLRSWAGAYSSGLKRDVERYFDVALPDLASQGRP